MIVLIVGLTNAVPAAPRKVKHKKKAVKAVKKPAPVVPGPSADQPAIAISNFAFNPPVITVSPGSSVIWNNLDSVPHTVTSLSGPEKFDSGELRQGARFIYKFTKVGTYNYYCSLHPAMLGKIIVQ